MTTIHGVQLSPFVRKVILVANAKGIDFTINPITPFSLPEDFDVISPLKKIPAFEDDMLAISDSSVICEYLDNRYPQQPMYPQDIVAKAQVRWFEEYADTAVVAVTAPLLFEKVIKKLLMKQDADEARVSKVINEEQPKVFDYLEGQLKDSSYLVGDSLTMADIAVGGQFLGSMYAGHQVDAKRWPKLANYLKNLFATTLFANCIASDKTFMTKASTSNSA